MQPVDFPHSRWCIRPRATLILSLSFHKVCIHLVPKTSTTNFLLLLLLLLLFDSITMLLFSCKFLLLFVTMLEYLVASVDGMNKVASQHVPSATSGLSPAVVSSSSRYASRSMYENANDGNGQNNQQQQQQQQQQEQQEMTFQEWMESQMTDEERQRQQEYEKQQQEYEEQLQEQEMEKYQQYLEWKWNMTQAGQMYEDNQGYYNYGYGDNQSTLSFVDSSDLAKGRQWAIGSSMLLVGMLAGFGFTMLIMRNKNKKTTKTQPLMDDPTVDMA
jgi:hypothetical protein